MSPPTTFTIPRAVSFGKEQMEEIEECLDELARNTGAWSILLTDTTGQLIEIQGRIDKKNAEALAALIAGSYGASTEFIKILSKDKDVYVNSFSHEATNYSIFTMLVDEVLILSVAFKNTAKVGIVRVFADKAQRRLSEIVHEASLANSDTKDINRQLADNDLNRLLNDELEKLTEFEA